MREILFRGKIKDTDEWIYGVPIKSNIGVFINFDENPHYCDQYKYMEIDRIAMVDTESVGQYIGLHDSTKWEQLTQKERDDFLFGWNYEKDRHNTENDWIGRKIFENDIVWIPHPCTEEKDSVCQVFFQDGMFIGKMADGSEDSICAAEKVYVVGNIFDHQELLQVQEPRKMFRTNK